MRRRFLTIVVASVLAGTSVGPAFAQGAGGGAGAGAGGAGGGAGGGAPTTPDMEGKRGNLMPGANPDQTIRQSLPGETTGQTPSSGGAPPVQRVVPPR